MIVNKSNKKNIFLILLIHLLLITLKKNIPREQGLEIVKKIFDFFDQNKDGFIEANEIKAASLQFGKAITDQEVNEKVFICLLVFKRVTNFKQKSNQ